MSMVGACQEELNAAFIQEHLHRLLLWLKDEAFVLEVAEWSWDECMEFPTDVSIEAFEHPLHFTEMHQQYRQLFERRAEQYLRAHGLDVENFLHMACKFMEKDPLVDASGILEGLVASESYTSFFTYMGAIRRRRQWAEETVCGVADELDWGDLVRRAMRQDLGDMADDPHLPGMPLVQGSQLRDPVDLE